jgi:hypothetical protein
MKAVEFGQSGQAFLCALGRSGLRSICAHDPAHYSNTLGAEAKNLPHLFGGGYRIANDVGTHRSGANALVRRRKTV